MNTLQIFFAEFWPTFIGVSIGLSFVWLVRRFATGGYFLFTSPKAFRELAPFSQDEQKRLLEEASGEASRSWQSVIPIITFALVVSCGSALGRTVPKVSSIPDTFWVHVAFPALFAGACCWFVVRLAAICVRPFLRRLIERTSHVG